MKQNKANNDKKVIKVLGIDLAKNSFQLHGVDKNGHVVLKKKLSRLKLAGPSHQGCCQVGARQGLLDASVCVPP